MQIEQFKKLLIEVNEVYNKSNLIQKELYYSLVGTKIVPNEPLIIGLNWGGGSDEDKEKVDYIPYKPQTIACYETLLKENTHIFSTGLEIGSLSKLKQNIEDYTDIDISNSHIGWTNFCFFRTPNENFLSNEDIELTKPIFLKLINIIKPKMIICVSSKLRDFMLNSKNLNFRIIKEYKAENNDGLNKYNGLIGDLNGCPFYSLPHPASQIEFEARKKAWNTCFGNIGI